MNGDRSKYGDTPQNDILTEVIIFNIHRVCALYQSGMPVLHKPYAVRCNLNKTLDQNHYWMQFTQRAGAHALFVVVPWWWPWFALNNITQFYGEPLLNSPKSMMLQRSLRLWDICRKSSLVSRIWCHHILAAEPRIKHCHCICRWFLRFNQYEFDALAYALGTTPGTCSIILYCQWF